MNQSEQGNMINDLFISVFVNGLQHFSLQQQIYKWTKILIPA